MQVAERSIDPADLFVRLEQLNDIGVALSRQTDISRLLETILVAAKNITNADGGTLYRVTEERTLQFEIMRNDTLGIAMGGTTGVAVPFPPIALYDSQGVPVMDFPPMLIDPDLFDVFMWQRVNLDYASKWMDPEQIDAIDTSKIPGYVDPLAV